MNIVLASDKNMVGATGVCLKSIALSNPLASTAIYLLCGEIPETSKRLLREFVDCLGLKVAFIDVDMHQLEAVAAGLLKTHLTAGSLIRLAMARLLPADIERVLYIDVDTLVLRDLTELEGFDMGDAVLAACRTPMDHLEEKGVPKDHYFNAGVLLIDLAKWRTERVEERALSEISRDSSDLLWWDQCALNVVLQGHARCLPRTYNYIFDHKKALDHFEVPHIVHYAGTKKPWPNAANSPGWGALYFEMSADTPWAVKYDPPPERFLWSPLYALGLRTKLRRLLASHVAGCFRL